jgi:hypothetical protein
MFSQLACFGLQHSFVTTSYVNVLNLNAIINVTLKIKLIRDPEQDVASLGKKYVFCLTFTLSL